MKKSGILAAASLAAASATAISSPSSLTLVANSKTQRSREEVDSRTNSDNSAEKFAPRFDGLRFIETLVTAHR